MLIITISLAFCYCNFGVYLNGCGFVFFLTLGSITILWTYYLLIQSPAQAFQSSQEGNLRIIKL